MFYYFGRKKQLAGLYPDPRHGVIVEPFAGSAAYSLYGERWKNRVILFDTSSRCIGVWRFLQSCTSADIESLPDLVVGESVRDHTSLSQPEEDLIRYHINPGSNPPALTATRASRWPAGKRYIANNLHKIQHWEIHHKDYKEAPDITATWFVDPPYSEMLKRYYEKFDIDYTEIGRWVMNRKGMAIACEGGVSPPSYLPFNVLPGKVNNGGLNKSKRNFEYIYVAGDGGSNDVQGMYS